MQIWILDFSFCLVTDNLAYKYKSTDMSGIRAMFRTTIDNILFCIGPYKIEMNNHFSVLEASRTWDFFLFPWNMSELKLGNILIF